MKRLHLLCNAHLDPVWLWEWEEGAAEAISTFRTAADLCEEFGGFVFNHNEVILYQWVEEYEPQLFARIQRLVREGKWHIMGGWFLQPDCNMPSGESFVRQALAGRHYFQEKFGAAPETAINFDPFGHTRGLVQILKKSGYTSYLFGRPNEEIFHLPDDGFIWVGYDGSEVAAHRFIGWYNAPLGKAREKVENWLKEHGDQEIGLVLWGVGNHGGGPSRKDCQDLADLISNTPSPEIVHSTPEAYFEDVRNSTMQRPRLERDLNSWAPGCYTSQVRLKQKHRLLENELYAVEKMVSTAALQGLMPYPKAEIDAAQRDLLVGEFHDILPGSSVQAVEEGALRLLDHGLEILARIKARAFFRLASGQAHADGRIPILAYNPHPFPVRGTFVCEFNLPDFNTDDSFYLPEVWCNGKRVPSQVEKEAGNLAIDWRKRMVFHAELAPSQMTRFDCTLDTLLPERPKPSLATENGRIVLKTAEIEAVINCTTGLLDRYTVGGVDYLRPGACLPLVMLDNPDPWSTAELKYREIEGAFTLMDAETGTRFSGLRDGILESVRVIEDGPVRTVLESVLSYADSFLVLTYGLPKAGTEVEIHVRVHWNEKDRMLKLALPTTLDAPQYWGQVAFGRDVLPGEEREVVAQKWVAAVSEKHDCALTCINDGSYGSDFVDGEIRLTLLRSSAYAAHPFKDRPLVRPDGYTPRMEQGERQFRFWLNAGPREARMTAIDREALAHNERPFLLSFNPSGAGERPVPGIVLSDDAIQLTAFKQAERGDSFVIRLFEPTGRARTTELSIPARNVKQSISLQPFEIKTLLLGPTGDTLVESDLIEGQLQDE